ncbi:MAG TPA: hypothetical protein VGG11_13840 [Xanthobacteraceae bacterium]|jgi:hypothetical protein
MDQDDLHYPPGAEPQPHEPEPPKPEEKPADAEPPKPEEKSTPEPKPEEKPEEKPVDKPADPPPPLPKKRSIYDDLKDKKQEVKDFKAIAIAALQAQGIELTGKESLEELQQLAQHTPAPKPKDEKPADKPAPADELEAFAQENEIDPKSLSRLAEIIAKRIPTAKLSDQDKADLGELREWRSKQARAAEDQEILSQGPTVKAQLKDLGFEVHDDAETQNVMNEIVKLAHTERYHDKEVGYIVWSEREALSKLISPKKPSFERGGGKAEGEPEAPVDFSKGSVTPAQVADALKAPKQSYEVRKAQ